MSGYAGQGSVRRVALIGNHPPRMCGIATFTADVETALVDRYPGLAIDVYAMNDPGGDHAYPPTVVCTIGQDDIPQYLAAARRINDSGADVICVQHEYGIFGGAAGSHLLRLLDRVEAPVVVVLHTVLEHPSPEQRHVIEALGRRASRLIVMAQKGREILERVHGIPATQIAVVPHGVPDRPLVDSNRMKPALDLAGHEVLLTFGLLSPNKGIETMIRAMPRIIERHPNAIYVVLGATHPHLVAREGESYRESLIRLAEECGVADRVRFIDGFLSNDRLLDYLAAADVYVTPYLNEAQITSGTLSYAVALGRPVVSTPYWHAVELLADGVGRIVNFGDSDGFAKEIVALLDDEAVAAQSRERAYAIGRTMLWSRLAEAYMDIFHKAVVQRPVRLRSALPKLERQAPSLVGVERMSDGCGMMQHSIYIVPDRDHGYCVDDNARALILMHRMPPSERTDQLAKIYASFIQHAWNGSRGRFRNFMSYGRHWLEEVGSEDSFGRALWSIGVTAAEARNSDLRRWALHLFDQVSPHACELRSLRTRAFAILGAEAILSRHSAHPLANQIVARFGNALHEALHRHRRDGWNWFEPTLAYDNARLPEALLLAGERLGDRLMIDDGLATMAWIDAVQTAPEGHFRAVGTESFGARYEPPLPFDQQPLEAWATVEAAATALRLTGDPRWAETAERAYRWYLGDNDLGMPMAAPDDGGCFDGLMSDRANLNQGAESVLAFQLACVAMARLAEDEDHRSGNQRQGDAVAT
jgi:glycosyltransferase involved in cell wall biosynthesis